MDVGGQILQIIADYKQLELSQIEPSKSFADLDIDSLEALDLVYEIEDRLSVSVPQEALDDVKTVGDMLTVVGRLATGQGAA